MIVFAVEGSSGSCASGWTERSVRSRDQRRGVDEDAGSMTGRKWSGKVAADANIEQFTCSFRLRATAQGAKQTRARSSAASRFDMALHCRCNLLVRGACGNRQVECRRPSGQCAGTQEKGPPHLSRSCVVRVGGRHWLHASQSINRMYRSKAASEARVPQLGSRPVRRFEASQSCEVILGSSSKDQGVTGHLKLPGLA